MYIVVPAVLVGWWLLLMIGRRRVGWVFFVVAFGLSGLLFPFAYGVDRLAPVDPGCSRGQCYGSLEVAELIISGFVGVWCAGGLLAVTLLVELVRLGFRLVARWRERDTVEWRDEDDSNEDFEYEAPLNPRRLGG